VSTCLPKPLFGKRLLIGWASCFFFSPRVDQEEIVRSTQRQATGPRPACSPPVSSPLPSTSPSPHRVHRPDVYHASHRGYAPPGSRSHHAGYVQYWIPSRYPGTFPSVLQSHDPRQSFDSDFNVSLGSHFGQTSKLISPGPLAGVCRSEEYMEFRGAKPPFRSLTFVYG